MLIKIKKYTIYILNLTIISICLIAFLAGPISAQTTQELIVDGLAKILDQQNEDGGWPSVVDGPSNFIATCQLVNILRKFNLENDASYIRALNWLSNQQINSTELLARYIEILVFSKDPSLDDYIDLLVSKVNEEDKGWGRSEDYLSNVLDTALSLHALYVCQYYNKNVIESARLYLISEQNDNGSWSLHKDEKASVCLTGFVALCLTEFSPVFTSVEEEAINRARQWLINNQNPDGGWGIDASTIYDTTMAYKALQYICGLSSNIQSRLLNYLMDQYAVDTAWQDSSLLTGLSIEALNRINKPDLYLTSYHIIPDDLNPVHGIDVPLSLYIHNQGGTDVYNVKVSLFIGEPDQGGEKINDIFIDFLAAGSSELLNLFWNTTGLLEQYQLYVVVDPDDDITESYKGNNNAFVEGVILENCDLNVGLEDIEITFPDSGQTISRDNIYEGMQINIRCQIHNLGQKEARNVLVVAYDGDPDEGGIFLSSRTLAIIRGNHGKKYVFIPWDTTGYGGDYNIHILIDPDDEISELSEENNHTEYFVNIKETDNFGPSAPTGLEGEIITEREVRLTWDVNTEGDIAGYNIYRRVMDGESPWRLLNLKEIAVDGVPSASDSYNLRFPDEEYAFHYALFDIPEYLGPLNLIDRVYKTIWVSNIKPFDYWEEEPCYVQLDFTELQLIQRLEIYWLDYDSAGQWFEIQTWDGAGWQVSWEIKDNLDIYSICILDQPVLTDKIRIHIVRGLNMDYTGISELWVYKGNSADFINENIYEDRAIWTLPIEYALTAVDYAGHESPKSSTFEVHDNVPPVVEITSPKPGERVGGDVVYIQGSLYDNFLTGYSFAYGAGDNPQEWIHQTDCMGIVKNGLIFEWIPPPGLNGIYTLRLMASDMGANVGVDTVTFFIDTTPPAIPKGLKGRFDGEMVLLNWDSNSESDLYGYNIFRNGEKLGDKDIAQTGSAAASSSYFDVYAQRGPNNAIDGDTTTYWRPMEGTYPYWWQITFPERHEFSKIYLAWDSFVGHTFSIQSWDSEKSQWISQREVESNTLESNIFSFPELCETDKILLIIHKAVISSEIEETQDIQITDADREAPYPILAEVKFFIPAGIIQETEYHDLGMDEKEYIYAISAIDDLGNESKACPAVLLDKRSPRITIVYPEDGQRVGRSLMIMGKVEDRYLKHYIVEAGRLAPGQSEPDEWDVIYTSISQVRKLGPLAVWYPTDLVGDYLFRVTAEDYEGYRGMDQVKLHVDSLPPAPPDELIVSRNGSAINLQWQAPTANLDGSAPLTDLVGYNIYRNDFILNLKDIASIGQASAKTTLIKTQCFPRVNWDPSFVINTCFGYEYIGWRPKPYDSPSWWQEVFRQPYTINKIEIRWDKDDWLWPRDYQIQTWDLEAEEWITQVDIKDNRSGYSLHQFNPTTTNRVRIYLTRGPSALYVGGISRVNVYREDNVGTITGTYYQDTEFNDLEAVYHITALDDIGNESPKTSKGLFDNAPPRVKITDPQPGSLYITSDYSLKIYGTVEDSLLVEYLVRIGKGDSPTYWETLNHIKAGPEVQIHESAKLAAWQIPQDEEGTYTIQLLALDKAGLQGKDKVAIHIDTKAPEIPLGLYGEEGEEAIELWWNENMDDDLAGYNIYRNGKQVNVEDIAPTGKIEASSYLEELPKGSPNFPFYIFNRKDSPPLPAIPESAVDSYEQTVWINMTNNWPCWWRCSFLSLYEIKGMNITWFPEIMGKDFLIQTWQGDKETGEWITQVSINDLKQTESLHLFPSPVTTNKVRIYITRGLNERVLGIKEAEVLLQNPLGLLHEPYFLDTGIVNPEFFYAVTAVDQAGNESSATGMFVVDPLSPRVSIDSPIDGEKTGNYIEIKGTVADNCLTHYIIDYGQGNNPEHWEVIDDIALEIDQDILSIWEPPFGLDGLYTLRIRAWDMANRKTEERLSIHVDTTPPSQPLVLSGDIQEGKVLLDWLDNTEGDLVGYNVYCNGKAINLGNITHLGRVSTSRESLDAYLATDGNRNTNWLLYPFGWWQMDFDSQVSISKIVIEWGSIDFSYQISLWDGENWIPRVSVCKNKWKKRVHYLQEASTIPTDKVRISVSWLALVGGIPIKEITIYQQEGGIIPASYYEHQGINEVGFRYQVTAVDEVGNESPLSDEIFIDTDKPVAEIIFPKPYNLLKGTVSIFGSAWDRSFLYYRLEIGEGLNPTSWKEIIYSEERIKDGLLGAWEIPQGLEGEYILRLSVYDTSLKEGIARYPVLIDTKPPDSPEGLEVVIVDDSVQLTWQAGPEDDILGYNIYCNGYKINRINIAPIGEAHSHTSYYGDPISPNDPYNTIDGNLKTGWLALPIFSYGEELPTWLEIDLTDLYKIEGVTIHWLNESSRWGVRDYWIQTWDGSEWINQVIITADTSLSRSHTFTTPISTNKIRVYFYMIKGDNPCWASGIQEVEILAAGHSDLITDTSYEDREAGDLENIYMITAVDRAGNESPQSLPFSIDNTPPRVQITSPIDGAFVGSQLYIKGTVEDNHLLYYTIEYGEGNDPIRWHRIYKGSEIIKDGILAQWYPPDGLDGIYSLRITAYDKSGSTSNDNVWINLDTTGPEAPQGLFGEIITDSAIQLNWIDNQEEDLAGYYIYRDGERLNRQNIILEGTASASSSYSDYTLPWKAVDTDPYTFWCSNTLEASFWQVEFKNIQRLNFIAIYWYLEPRYIRIQTWDEENHEWITQETKVAFWYPGLYQTEWYDKDFSFSEMKRAFDPPVWTSKLRILMTGNSKNYYVDYYGIREVTIYGTGLVLSPVYSDETLSISQEHTYQVSAVDLLGNEGPLSDPFQLDAHAPEVKITFPHDGAFVGRDVDIYGTVYDTKLLTWGLEYGAGTNPTSWIPLTISNYQAGRDKLLAKWSPQGNGLMTLRLYGEDIFGNFSEDKISVKVDTVRPSPPTGLQASINAEGIQLYWNVVAGDTIIGYNLYRNGKRVNVLNITDEGAVIASSERESIFHQYNPSHAVDNSLHTLWQQVEYEYPCWWQIEFPIPYMIGEIIIDWSDYYCQGSTIYGVSWGKQYSIEAWLGEEQAGQILISENQDLHRQHNFDIPILADKIRVMIYESQQTYLYGKAINTPYIGLNELSVYRRGITGLIRDTFYLDLEKGDIGAKYTVTSVDQAGNESFPSLPFSIGDCPPDVFIHSPSKNDLVSTGIEIKGSVRDQALTVYKVLVGPGPNPWQWEQIGYGREETENDILAIWEIPKGIEQTYTIKLTAINNLGIIGTESIPVIVDTIAPEAPRGLTCTRVQDTVGLSWEPNIEKDIAGYNIYRNGQLLNTIEIPHQDIVATASNYLDHYYAYLPELAIDGQEDTGWMTNEYPCWLEFDLGLPYRIKGLEFISYDYFDYPQYPPKDYYIQTWDGQKYVSQAAAIGNVQTFCRYLFKQPVITSKIRIYIEGNSSTPRTGIGEVTIYRKGVSSPIPSQLYYDDEFLDFQNTEFIYNVTAVDKLNNESIKSYQAIFDLCPPLVRIDHPQNNQWVGNQLSVTGAIEDSFLDEFTVEIGEGMDPGIWQIIHRGYTYPQNDTIMVWNIPQGMEGTYQIKVTAWDKNKNETYKTVSINMDTKRPISPKGFTGKHNDDQIQFHWDPNPESDIEGYNLYRNEEKVNRSDVSHMASASASSFNPYGPPQNILDDDDTTFWLSDTQDTYPIWLELGFPVALRISALTLKWRQHEYGVNFNIQTWNNDSWENVVIVSDNAALDNNLQFDPLLISNRIRIYIFSGAPSSNRATLLEAKISQPGGLITANSFTEYGIVTGGFHYWITAVDRAMNESPPSTILSFDPISLQIEWEKKDYNWFDSITDFDNVFPVFADLDNDKDLDLIMGDYNGEIIFCPNEGTIFNPSFSSMITQIDYAARINSHPSLGDMDDDGDLDMVVGTDSGLTFYRNVGTNQIPQWQKEEDFFSAINGGTYTIPDFVDFDGDQDLDLILFAAYEVDHGYYTSTENFFKCFENKGSKENPVWEENTSYLATLPRDMPFLNSFDFVDLDHDGIIDPIYNNGDEYMQFFKNIGTENMPQWVAETSVFNNLEKYGAFALGDLDNDGDLDLLVAEYFIWDILHYYENRGDDDYGPQNTSIQINQGQTSTLTPQVTLSLYAEGAVSIKISNYRDGAMGMWMDYTEQADWALPAKAPHGAVQRVYVQFKNASGHLSPTVSDDIICNFGGNPADVNGDTDVNIYDLVLVARRIGAKEGDQLYEPKYDVKFDNVINIFDLIIVARELGK